MSYDTSTAVRLTEQRVAASEPRHLHLGADESLLVLTGAVVLSVGCERTVLTTGDVASIRAGEVHVVAPVGAEALVVLSHRRARPDEAIDLPVNGWPVLDGLGTLLLGPQAATSTRSTPAAQARLS